MAGRLWGWSLKHGQMRKLMTERKDEPAKETVEGEVMEAVDHSVITLR